MVRVAKKSTRSDVEVVNWWVGVEDGGGGASESRMDNGQWSMENGARRWRVFLTESESGVSGGGKTGVREAKGLNCL